MTVREIQAFLADMYAVDVSLDFISTVTDAVHTEVTAWQSRPLEPMYPVVFFDALRVKIRDEATVRSKAVYLALAILPDGSRDILCIWIEQTEGAKFWMKVFTDLKTRGCQDILIAVTHGLTGMSEALAAIYPTTTLQTCIVHLLRHSLDVANWQERTSLAAALRPVYTAASADAAGAALDVFAQGPWDAATKLIWLAPRNITAGWGKADNYWHLAMNQFAILYEDRFTGPRTSMHRRMDAPVPVDAQNAPTATWNTARARGFPQRPHALSSTRPTPKKPDTPRISDLSPAPR